MLETASDNVWVGAMMRLGTMAILVTLVGGVVSLQLTPAKAEPASPALRVAQAAPQDYPPPRRLQRPPTRLRVYPYYEQEGVYPHYYPGSDAVRVCNAHYVQEYRPSGTVIV